MHLRWPVWGGRARHRSRPRVAQAIQAARAIQTNQASQATSGVWVGHIQGSEAREQRSLVSYAVRRRRAAAGLSPALLRATARVARASGRQPAEVWAEALYDWLIGNDQAAEEMAARPVVIPPDPRRTRAWQSIDATLGDLRAS
jgi:hypothetical protein